MVYLFKSRDYKELREKITGPPPQQLTRLPDVYDIQGQTRSKKPDYYYDVSMMSPLTENRISNTFVSDMKHQLTTLIYLGI